MTLQYACRKTLADRRVRVRGRFARNNEMCDNHHQEIMVPKNNNDLNINNIPIRKERPEVCCADAIQVYFSYPKE